MRPLILRMSAFGPYASEETVDFGKLGREGLFLVTGDMGAGKTTIFDAITYALFGESSGQARESSMFRSMYADVDCPTWVDLEFEYAGKKYKVHRSPTQMRPARRGKGLTEEKGKVWLQIDQQAPIENNKEVERRLKEILGVDFNQYSQIAMIAQGEFRKLLLADTKERLPIFREIFRTGNFLKLQQQLAEESKNLYVQVGQKRQSVLQYIDDATCEEENPLAQELAMAKEQTHKNKMTTAEVREVIEKVLHEDESRFTLQEAEQNRLKAEIDASDKRLEQYNIYLKNKQKHDEQSAKKTELEQTTKMACEASVKESMARQPEIDKLTDDISKINLLLPKYTVLNKCTNDIIRAERDLHYQQELLGNEQKSREKLEGDIQKMDDELKELKDPAADIANLEHVIKENEQRRKELSDLSTRIGNYNNLNAELAVLRADVRQKQESFAGANAKYTTMYSLFFAEQAGYLAENLQEGQPCPVCGATHHVKLAKKAADAPSEAELQRMENEKNMLQGKAEDALARYKQKEGVVQTTKEMIQKEIAEKLDNINIEQAPASIKSRLEELKRLLEGMRSQLKSFEFLKKRKTTLETDLPKKRTDLQKKISQLNSIQVKIAELETTRKNLQETEKELQKELPYRTEAEARNILQEHQNNKAKLEQAIKDAQEALNKCNQDIAGLGGSISELAKLIAEVPQLDVESETSSRDNLLQQKRVVDDKIQKIAIAKANNQKVLRNMDSASGDLVKLEKEYQMKNLMAQTAEGKLNGKERINLETYVLMSYFERIIQRANTRLMIMSSGQYELRRSKTTQGNAQIGLNLDVLDHYNGSTRDVKTLSGGESFMASLSLALGLSDEIQSSAGGIQLDTLFVDEGFGSLDDEALAQALKALSSLTEGNRLVGIISHVAELKKIDKQIVVTKDHQTYSHVQVVV